MAKIALFGNDEYRTQKLFLNKMPQSVKDKKQNRKTDWKLYHSYCEEKGVKEEYFNIKDIKWSKDPALHA